MSHVPVRGTWGSALLTPAAVRCVWHSQLIAHDSSLLLMCGVCLAQPADCARQSLLTATLLNRAGVVHSCWEDLTPWGVWASLTLFGVPD